MVSVLFRDMMWQDMVESLAGHSSDEWRATHAEAACDYVEYALGDVGVFGRTVYQARQSNENTKAV